MMATDMLRADHERVKGLFHDYDTADDENVDAKTAIAQKVFMELEIHSTIEEEIFYPAVREQGGDQVGRRAAVAGEQVDQLLLPLLGGGGGALGLADLGAGHVGEPGGPPGGVEDVPEEGAPAEDHVPATRFGAGGGVAALEAMVALRHIAKERVDVTLLAPDKQFTYRPLAVAKPFALGSVARFPLEGLANGCGARYEQGALVLASPDAHSVYTSRGRSLDYDALLVACGAQVRDAIPGAITFRETALLVDILGVIAAHVDGPARRGRQGR